MPPFPSLNARYLAVVQSTKCSIFGMFLSWAGWESECKCFYSFPWPSVLLHNWLLKKESYKVGDNLFPLILNPWQFWQPQSSWGADSWSSWTNVGFCLQSVGDSDVNYDRQLVLAFFCEYKTQRGRHRCSYVGLVPVGRNVRMFLEYLNYVVHVLPIAQERKTHK